MIRLLQSHQATEQASSNTQLSTKRPAARAKPRNKIWRKSLRFTNPLVEQYLRFTGWIGWKWTKRFVKSVDVDLDSTYVFFKNNCPLGGPLYDDFRICDVESGNVLYTVTPKCGHTGEAELWGRENEFDGPLKTGKVFADLLV